MTALAPKHARVESNTAKASSPKLPRPPDSLAQEERRSILNTTERAAAPVT